MTRVPDRISTMSAIGLLALIAVSLASGSSVGAEKVSDYDRFQLWNGCKPIDLVVEVHATKEDGDVVPTEKAVEVAVRSRLRGARLYDPDGAAYLYAYIHVVGTAFRQEIEFWKRVHDLASGQTYGTAIWEVGSTGTHGGNADYILGGTARHVDEFIDEYLRVNASECSR